MVKDLIVGVVVGTAIGTAAGLWTTRDAAAPAAAVASKPTGPPTATLAGTGAAHGAPGERAPLRKKKETAPTTADQVGTGGSSPADRRPDASRTEAAVAPDAAGYLQRAHALAARADVKALIAIREAVVQRAQDAGELQLPRVKRDLEQLDRYLEDARARRLVLDAQEFRKASASR